VDNTSIIEGDLEEVHGAKADTSDRKPATKQDEFDSVAQADLINSKSGHQALTSQSAATRMAKAPDNRSRTKMPRFRLLDGLRLLAALSVVLYHFTAFRTSAWGIPVSQVFPNFSGVTAFGAFGVQLFFIISGFVILLSAWGRSVGEFTASRVGRLFPGYWVGVALTSLLLLVVRPSGVDITITQSLVNLTMLQDPLGVDHIDGVYWTLWAELKFYLIMGVLIAVGITRNRIIAVCALWPVIAALAERSDSKLLIHLLMPEYAPLFAGGMILFLIFSQGSSVFYWILLGMNFIIAADQASNGHFQAIQKYTGYTFPDYACWIAVGIAFLAVGAATLTRLNRISWASLSTAGALTFPLYLVHEQWGWWYISLMSPILPHKIVLAAAISLCLVMALLIWQFVEKPYGPRLRRAIQSGLTTMARRNA